ncbi:MAG: lytic transglycosylase domain-containing protein [Terriglobales bacterium]
MRDLRQPIVVFAAVCALALPVFAGDGGARANSGIVAVQQNGRTVYVNAESPASAMPHRYSVLVYWSNAEHAWKRVPPPTAGMLASARNAAAEVASYVSSRPRGTSTSRDPNYTSLSRGHRVSSQEIDSAIDTAAAKHSVDANLVRAIVKQESNFNPSAVSNKGAMGLMQLMPGTARQLGVTDPFDPQQNVEAGVRHLKHLLDDFNGNVELSLAAYNAGEGAVTRNNGVPPYPETREYVKRITERAGTTPGARVVGPSSAPVKMFRNKRGEIEITNTE